MIVSHLNIRSRFFVLFMRLHGFVCDLDNKLGGWVCCINDGGLCVTGSRRLFFVLSSRTTNVVPLTLNDPKMFFGIETFTEIEPVTCTP